MKRAWRVFLIMVVLVFGACKAEPRSRSDAGAPGTAVPDARDARTAEQRNADEMLAKDSLLVLSDFEPGWQSDSTEDDDDDAEGRAKLNACLGRVDRDESRAESPDFVSPDESEVNEQVGIFATSELATDHIGLYKSPKAPGCFERLFKELASSVSAEDKSGANLELGELSVNELSIRPFGDESVAYRSTVEIKAKELSLRVYLDTVVVRHGRALALLNFSSTTGAAFPVSDSQQILDIAIRKLIASVR